MFEGSKLPIIRLIDISYSNFQVQHSKLLRVYFLFFFVQLEIELRFE